MIAEVVGGLIAHSLAILTDAAHLLSDVAGMFMSVAAIKLAQRVATEQFSFGFARAEVLGALFSCMLIWALTGILVYEAIRRMITLEEVDGMTMTIVACLGLVVNLLMLFVLGGHSHGGQECGGHGHGGDGDMNVLAAQIHILGDLVQTIGVIIAAILIWTEPWDIGHSTASNGDRVSNWNYADPICTCIFAILVLMTTSGIVRDAVLVLMQSKPKSADTEELKRQLEKIAHVVNAHDIHVWAASPANWVLTVHLEVSHALGSTTALDRCCAADEVLADAQTICANWGAWHTTIQIEHAGGWSCDTDCKPGEHAGRRASVDAPAAPAGGHGHSHGGTACGGH